ncbi:unnamed protein product [Auanema sp. JU1783]|nr:unnamed protein product [Auanema sp. JU1783]
MDIWHLSNRILSAIQFNYILASVDEFRLLQYLKENYNYFERPVYNSSDPLDVKVRLFLNQILDVDEKNQIMSILAYVDYHWFDYKLHWDPEKFGGIRDIRFAGEKDAPFKLWKPDILLFNSVSEVFDSTYSSRFVVNYDGHVQQNPPGIFKFICKIDVTYYPFDKQTCYLKMGSWTYSGNYINLDFLIKDIIGIHGYQITANKIANVDNPASYYVNESIDLQVYLKNGEWDLMNTPGRRVVTFFEKESYHELYFYIRIRRRTLAYGINLIIPSLVISMMTVLGFTLPPDAGEKMTLETTVLLSVIFFLQMVSNMSPPQSKSVPILAAFFACCLMVVSCSCVFTVLSLALHNRKMSSMGKNMRKVFIDWLPYILLMKRPDHPRAPKPKIVQRTVAPIHRLSTCIPMLEFPQTSVVNKKVTNTENVQCLVEFCDYLNEISKDLDRLRRRIDEKYQQEILESEWRFASMVVDRMCLYLFSLFITISTCGIILPNIIETFADN